MALDAVKNKAKVIVSTGYDDSDDTIILSTDEGDKLPDPAVSGEFNLVWWNYSDYRDPSDDPNFEIVRCTARVTNTLTVTRAQESTSASTKNTSGKVYKMLLGVTAKMITDINTALEARQPLDAELTALAGLTSAANKLPYFTGSETAGVTDLTAFARSILDDADEATFKATVNLEIGTDVLAQQTIGIADDNLLEVDGSPNSAEYARFTVNGLEGRTEAEFKGDFNLEIGTDVQAYSATLDAVTGGTYTGDDSITTVGTIGAGTWEATDIAVLHGGTGASTAADARTNLGLVAGGAGDIWVEKAGDAMSGNLAITIADEGNATCATLTQNDVTNNPNALSIVNAGTGYGLYIDQNGNGKSVYIDTVSTSVGFQLYRHDCTSANELMRLQEITTGTQKVLYITNNGSGDSIFIDHNNFGIGLNIDGDCNSASSITGLHINVANAGAGEAYAAIFEAGSVLIGATSLTNLGTENLLIDGGVLVVKETTTPTADTNYGKIYTKNDNKLYFQDGAGVEHEVDFA